MNVINYKLQSIIIERDKMINELEDGFETLKTLEDIHEKLKDNPNLIAELQKSVYYNSSGIIS